MKKKEKKYNNKKLKNKKIMNEDYKMAISFVTVLFIVIALLGLLYFLNAKFVTKDKFQGKTTTTTAEVSYDDTIILATDVLSMKDKKYYVMVFDSSLKKDLNLYGALVNNYQGSTKLYSVDLSVKFNKNYYDTKKDEKLKVTKSQDFNFVQPTLLVVENKKITDAITDKDKIVKIMKEKASE